MITAGKIRIQPRRQGYYQLGLAAIPLLVLSVPLFFVAIGISANLQYALDAGTILSLGMFSLIGRNVINSLLVVELTPPITTKWKQAVVSAVALGLTAVTYQVVVNLQLTLPFLATQSSGNNAIILAGSAVSEEAFFRYFLLMGVFVILLLVTNQWLFSAVSAVFTQAVGWYIFHFYVYGNETPVLQFVLFTGIIFGTAFILTGNAFVTMGPHLFWNLIPFLPAFIAWVVAVFGGLGH